MFEMLKAAMTREIFDGVLAWHVVVFGLVVFVVAVALKYFSKRNRESS